jgi:hypothetical protein
MISAELLLLNGRERQREMMAQADRQRLARQLRDLSRLLTPAEIDEQSGYRFYEPGQVQIA